MVQGDFRRETLLLPFEGVVSITDSLAVFSQIIAALKLD